jgi:hypothetical protein
MSKREIIFENAKNRLAKASQSVERTQQQTDIAYIIAYKIMESGTQLTLSKSGKLLIILRPKNLHTHQ